MSGINQISLVDPPNIVAHTEPKISPPLWSDKEDTDATNLPEVNGVNLQPNLPDAVADSKGHTDWGLVVGRTKNRKVYYLSANLPPEIAKISHMIYEIFNDEKSYFGKTEQTAAQRISQHLSESLNLRDKANIHKAINENPDNFRIRIYPVPSDQSLVSYETRFIASKPKQELFNQNKGGAGGNATGSSKKKAEPKTPPKPTIDSSSSSSKSPEKLSPVRWYPYIKKNEKFALTPEGAKTNGPLVYVIKDNNANTKEGRRYYGKTSTTFAQRVYNHHTAIRKAMKENRQPCENQQTIDSTIAQSNLTESPPRFSIGIVKQLTLTEDPSTLENLMITTKNTLAPNGYNQRRGGGGPNGKKLAFDNE